MNVSDLLQDSPSQPRRRPPPPPHDDPPPQPAPTSPPSQQQHPHPPQPPYTAPPAQFYPPPFSRTDPAPMHRITPRPPAQMHIDATPAMASLQHPSPSAPPHVHPHTSSWGPPPAPRQGSSPLSMSALAPASASLHARTHPQQPQIKSAMSGPDRSPVVQRAHTSGSSTPIAAHSPTTKPLLTTAAGVLILDSRNVDDQIPRPAPNTSPGAAFKPGRDREKEWDQRERDRQQEDMDYIRHAARERVGGPFDRDRDRERGLPSPRERPLPSPHDRPIPPAHDRPIPSPHERDRPPHMRRMSPLARPSPVQPPPLRPPQAQQSPPGPTHRIPVGPNDRDRMPPMPHERPPHDRDRIHPPPFSHPHRQGPSILPGQSQFQAHPPDWDPRERDVPLRERERDVLRERDIPTVGGPPRDLVREKDLDPARDPEYAFHHDHDRPAYMRDRRMRDNTRDQASHLPQRDRDVIQPSQRDVPMPREREREAHPARERERLAERERDLAPRDMDIPRERDTHMQRERVTALHREGESGPGIPPRGYDRDRERGRTHSRIPSPLGINMGPGGPPIPSSSMTGPGAPGPLHPPPSHDLHPREREIQLANERERQLAWERERERDMDRRQYRERVPVPDRDNERIAALDRERAIAERDRAMYERDRIAFSDRDRGFPERERVERERMERDRAMLERDRMMNERERERVMLERGMPPEQRVVLERERVILERPVDRIPMRPHPYDMAERDRVEAFERDRERERLDAMERDREAANTSAGPSREREADKDRKALDVPPVEREGRPVGPGADRELVEKRDRERLELTERERVNLNASAREREPMNPPNREVEHPEVDRERLETRERFEILQREISDLVERDRLGGLDMVDRERLARLERESSELVERERLEMLERERLEMLERMPSAEELARARKEREKKPFVSLGMYVWPRTPFPYYFPEWIPTPIVEEDKPLEAQSTEAGSSSGTIVPTFTPQPMLATQIPTELRLTVLVPPSFLPPSRPQKFRLWGGGLPPPPPTPYTPSIYSYSRRRVYTDDSDVIQCAVHAGLLTWSGIARAKREGRTIRVVLALVPTLASASGAVKSGSSDVRDRAINGLSANGHVNGTASVPRTRTNTPLPPPASAASSMSSLNAEPQPPGYAGGVWASRFIGGWGESFYGEESAGRGDSAGRMSSFEEAEDDGRGCVSCGWGWGHDGSAFEVISVDVVERQAHVAPGLGMRNRAQRLAEYAQRRTQIFGLAPPPTPPLCDVTNTPKRRRLVDFAETTKGGLSEAAAIAEEAKKMQAMTISFGVPDRKRRRSGLGFKYDARVVQGVLFPHLYQDPVPPAKRRRVTGDVEMEDAEERCGIALESTTETYVVTWAAQGDKTRYTLAVLGSAGESTAVTPRPAPPIPGDASQTPAPTQTDTQSEDQTMVDLALDNVATDPPESSTPTPTSKTDASFAQSTLKLALRVLRSDISDNDFSFEKDVIVVRSAADDTKMLVDGEELKMRVSRWRWYARS